MYNLHPHQNIVLDKIKEKMQLRHKRILVSAPTGFGKTILSYEIIKKAIEKNNKVLFTCHRITLAEQSYKKFLPLLPQYLQGENKDITDNYKCLVASIHTLLNTDIAEPKIVIIDEVHYAYESSLIQSLFTKFPNAYFIGLSATPIDDRGFLLDGFNSIIDDYQTQDLTDLGFLTPFECYSPMSIDLSDVKIKGDDYDNKELETVINRININNSIVDNYIELGQNRTFICFAVNKNHCKELAECFINKGIKVGVITAETKDKQREKLIKDLHNGIIKGLISIEILTAGFDEPLVSCVIFATATKSWKKYIQCAGRGIRLIGLNINESIANGKSNCILLDCCENIKEHGLPNERKEFKFGKKIGRVLDRELKIDTDNEKRQNIESILTEEKKVYLKKISSILDLYDGKVYSKEADLQTDVNNYLEKTNYFWWRQNSGKAYIKDRWVHFASKNGLPDNTVFYDNTSFYFALELKLPKGTLTDYQKVTLPEMTLKKVLFFICESVYDVYKSIEHIEKNLIIDDEKLTVFNTVYNIDERQIQLRNRFKIPLYQSAP